MSFYSTKRFCFSKPSSGEHLQLNRLVNKFLKLQYLEWIDKNTNLEYPNQNKKQTPLP